MAAPRRVIEISFGDEDLAQLETIARSRTEPACRVERARILLAYRADPSAYAVGEANSTCPRPADRGRHHRPARLRRPLSGLGQAASIRR
jgi:hypothetical protein